MKSMLTIVIAVSSAQAGTCVVPLGTVPPVSGTTMTSMGWSIRGAGDVAILGSPNDANDGSNAGGAVIYRRGPAGWSPETVLHIGVPSPNFQFGAAVAIEGSRAVVGVPGASFTPGQYFGAVLVYEFDGPAWQLVTGVQRAVLEFNVGYGGALDMEGDSMLVGAAYTAAYGTVYTFTRTGTAWVEGPSLTVPDADHYYFGSKIVMNGAYAAVLAPYGNNDGGAVYIFKRVDGAWSHTGTLTSPVYDYPENFGVGLAMSDDCMAVGVRNNDNGEERVEVFRRTGEAWSFEQTVRSPSAEEYEYEGFGYSIALDGERLLVGASSDRTDSACSNAKGTVYVFDRTQGDWTLRGQLNHPEGTCDTSFGGAIGLVGDDVLVTAPYDVISPDQGGSVHAFAFDAPKFVGDPAGAVLAPGGTAQFNAAISSAVAHTPTWRKNGVPIADGNRTRGADTLSLTISDVEASDFGAYDCVVVTACGDVVGSAPAPLAVAPAICPGDANSDRVVSFADITEVLTNFNLSCP